MTSIPERVTALLQELGHGETTGASMNALMGEARAILIEREKFTSTDEQRAAARERHCRYSDHEIEIDEGAQTSPTDGGTWVQAWVWLADPEEDEDDDECATCAAATETRAFNCDECGHSDEHDDA